MRDLLPEFRAGRDRPKKGGAGLVPLALLAATSLAVWLGLSYSTKGQQVERERDLADRMTRAMALLRDDPARLSPAGSPLSDSTADPNGSGLIGLEWSPITTTLGSLPAKRSAAQPAAAILLRRLLGRAGVREGDVVAIDSSGSFPGFAIAASIAAESLGARVALIASVGSSQWGANRPEQSLPDMLILLADRGITGTLPVAVSPGGDRDTGGGMDPDALAAILDRVRARGIDVIIEPALADNVARRMRTFRSAAGGRRIAAFVSSGGNWASTGARELPASMSGLIMPPARPDTGANAIASVTGDGMIGAFLRAGVPSIRLIDVRDLCARTGLPYDPVPWPDPESIAWFGEASTPDP